MHQVRASIGFVIAAMMAIAVSSTAHAGWLGYKNESTVPVVVQTSTVVNNVIVRGKAHTLYPGEIAWDNIPAPAVRQLSVFDAKNNNKLILQDTVTLVNRDVFLSVRSETPAQQPGKPAPQPVFKLAATVAPVPGGVIPQPQPQGTTNPTTPAPKSPPGKNAPTQEPPKGSQTPPPPASKSGS